MPVVWNDTKNPIRLWIDQVGPVESSAVAQLRNMASLDFVYPHIAVMPDVHMGKGATVGSVFPTLGHIVPAAVGVDLGCGMNAVKLSLRAEDLPDNLSAIRSAIEKAVPHGRTNNGKPGDRGAWHNIPQKNIDVFDLTINGTSLRLRLQKILAKHPRLQTSANRALNHMGTLGTGNHFVEICLDQDNNVWVMLHSGSRGIGNAIGTYFIEKAHEHMIQQGIVLPDMDLSYLTQNTAVFEDYLEAVSWAQDFALENRKTMLTNTLEAIRSFVPAFTAESTAINCHHNYVQLENHYGKDVWLTRKGAVSAKTGELGIIPGSMGAKSFIVRGKGNPESFCSCSHGAGRKHSRNAAKKLFSVEDHIEATRGVECRKDSNVIDETPAAYKDIEAVMKSQEDLVDIVYTLKQILCVKG